MANDPVAGQSNNSLEVWRGKKINYLSHCIMVNMNDDIIHSVVSYMHRNTIARKFNVCSSQDKMPLFKA